MNTLLENKKNQLQHASDFECWYLVKHTTDFNNLCYLVTILDDYIQHSVADVNIETYIKNNIARINASKSLNLSDNYRALRVAAFFGLIQMTSSSYANAIITPAFNEIKERCNGEFEKIDLYEDIICRQIEKMFISSSIDEGSTGVRRNYKLYPVMLLYKILIEMGRSTGNYRISTAEYRYFVATTEKFEDFVKTLTLINLLREEGNDSVQIFEQFRTKFDNRMNVALQKLRTLIVDEHGIGINPIYIKEVAEKVYRFEENPNIFIADNYIRFLCSTKSLFEIEVYNSEERENANEQNRLTGGTNVILYGVPGAGKSWTIDHEYKDEDTIIKKIVFHPDYTYSDFVGQILPKKVNDSISYDFIPGPFTKIMKEAYENPSKRFILAIEEINRGNAPAIFGDIFQLLDRNENGKSAYEIINADIAKIVYGNENHEVSIPSNLSILCTMNTSDQNVFTLDTAFQRRWNMRLIENSFRKDNEEEKKFAEHPILDSDIKWESFCSAINAQILEKNQNMTSSEDKRLGTHFVNLDDLNYYDEETAQTDTEKLKIRLKNRRFPEKVIKYLWDDAFKFYRDEIFKAELNSLEKVIKLFVEKKKNDRFEIFKDNIRAAIFDENSKQ